MLENASFVRENLAVQNMIRAGLFGEILHCHCAHDHNVMYWYLDEKGYPRWSGNWLLKRNADQYPTHSLGPVIPWMDITRGDNFAYVTLHRHAASRDCRSDCEKVRQGTTPR